MSQVRADQTRRVYHVTFDHPSQKWEVKRERKETPEKRFDRKEDAIEAGKRLGKEASLGQLIIHDQRGIIQTEYTYGKDPRDTPG